MVEGFLHPVSVVRDGAAGHQGRRVVHLVEHRVVLTAEPIARELVRELAKECPTNNRDVCRVMYELEELVRRSHGATMRTLGCAGTLRSRASAIVISRRPGCIGCATQVVLQQVLVPEEQDRLAHVVLTCRDPR